MIKLKIMQFKSLHPVSVVARRPGATDISRAVLLWTTIAVNLLKFDLLLKELVIRNVGVIITLLS